LGIRFGNERIKKWMDSTWAFWLSKNRELFVITKLKKTESGIPKKNKHKFIIK